MTRLVELLPTMSRIDISARLSYLYGILNSFNVAMRKDISKLSRLSGTALKRRGKSLPHHVCARGDDVSECCGASDCTFAKKKRGANLVILRVTHYERFLLVFHLLWPWM